MSAHLIARINSAERQFSIFTKQTRNGIETSISHCFNAVPEGHLLLIKLYIYSLKLYLKVNKIVSQNKYCIQNYLDKIQLTKILFSLTYFVM